MRVQFSARRAATSLTCGVLAAMIALAPAANADNAQYEYATHHELGLMQGFPPAPEAQVTRDNALFGVPQNRWSYQNMRSFFPSADIAAAQYAIDLDRAIDGAIEELDITRLDGSQSDFKTYLEETFTDALVVVKDGKVVHESYLNGMNADQPHQMMSVTKSFAGLFGLIAAHEGKVSEDDKVADIIPELGVSGAFGDATFGEVLDMTNSMNFTEDYADPNSGIQEYGRVLGMLPSTDANRPANTIYEYLPTLDNDDAHEHGEVFHYQTPKTDVVNWVANRATGKSFQDNLEDVLWKKIGADGETYVLLDSNGTLFAGGGLNATPNNLARFAAMMLNDGEVNGQEVVDPDVIQQLSDGGNIDAFSNGPESAGVMGNKDWSYRAQWWVRHTEGKEAFSAIGIHGQWIYIDVERDVAIIKQSSQPVSKGDFFETYDVNAFDAIVDHLSK
ncbi:hypothetical protein BXY66_2948 [Shimia isoporae]|uniref:Beta-lactamase-related domain-containing protein n=1 Tax=Shimia isoporae TaxID=647720 RepID=A0A4R1N6C8_9RHOB|nr:serine hydrolase [Shimia isoporae]TCL00307.1 hypothetical protein BXY66_2948 [Shimia isoporae]